MVKTLQQSKTENGSKWRAFSRVRGGGRRVQGKPPVVGIVCALARPRGSPRAMRRSLSAASNGYMLVRSVLIVRDTVSQLYPATKAPSNTHRFAPTTLAGDMRSLEERNVSGAKNPATGASRDIRCQKQWGYGRAIGSGACACPHRHPQTFAPYAQHHWGQFDTPGASFPSREPTEQSRSTAP